MSATPYLEIIAGAAPITGTGAATVLAAPPADIDDTDINDEFEISHVAEFLNHAGEPVAFHFDLLGNGLLLHRNTFSSIGSDDDVRIFRAAYIVTPLTTTEALVECQATLSGSGEVGPNSRLRTTATLDAPFDITDLGSTPIVLDLQVTLDTADSEYVFTPLRTRIHKTEPVLSAGVGGGAVTSVNGETGVVVLTAAEVGAAAENATGTPIVSYNRTGPNAGTYDPRPLVADAPHVDYEGPVEPTNANCQDPNFEPDADFWRKTSS